MTNRTIDENAGDALEVGPSIEELFAPLEESRDTRDSAVDPSPHETELSPLESRVDEIADRTADDVFEQFEQFRSEIDGEYDVDGVLADESPEEIMASADEDEDEDDADILGDEKELEDLLLTGRQAESEFLWVDTDAEDASSSEPPVSEEAASRQAEESTAEESSVAVSEGDESTDSAPTQAEPLESASGKTGDAKVSGEITTGTADDHDEETVTTEVDEDRPSGFFGWLRAKLGL